MSKRAAILLCWWFLGSTAHAQVLINDNFDALDLANWCPCRINLSAFHVSQLDDGTSFGRIIVEGTSVGGNACTDEEKNECKKRYTENRSAARDPTEMQDLGASIVTRPPDSNWPADAPSPWTPKEFAPESGYCTPEVRALGMARNEEPDTLCIQREELTLPKSFSHPIQTPLIYSFRFRMPETIEDTIHSVRWVTAQWKQTTVDESYRAEFGADWGPSPFLAQRFDDGVLHITVQDDHCRCLVAWADHPGKPAWKDGAPAICESTRPDVPSRTLCKSQLHLEYGEQPELSDPRGEWVEMSYRVQAGRSGDSSIEIKEGGRTVVTVIGPIGYSLECDSQGRDLPTSIYFKIGHYRDYMPWTHAMDIDWVRLEQPAVHPSIAELRISAISTTAP